MDSKLKEWAVAFIVSVMIFAAWWSVTTVNAQSDADRLAVICVIEQQNRIQLKVISDIQRELGLPSRAEIPEVSEQCREL